MSTLFGIVIGIIIGLALAAGIMLVHVWRFENAMNKKYGVGKWYKPDDSS